MGEDPDDHREIFDDQCREGWFFQNDAKGTSVELVVRVGQNEL